MAEARNEARNEVRNEVRKEYIEREAVEKYIESLYQPWEHKFQDRDNIKRQLKRIPTADVVEVVRCEECVYCNKYRKWNGQYYFGCNRIGEIYDVEPTHYCSYGERKEV